MSVRSKLAEKKTKLAEIKKTKIKDHPASLGNFQNGTFVKVPIDLIVPDPDQPRKFFDKEALKELAASIKNKGVLQPVIVRKGNDNFVYLVAGERRLRASKMAGIDELPAVFTDGNPAEIALIENVQREDLKPIEEAEAYARMIDEYNYTQEALASVVGKGRTTITEILSLNKLPDNIKKECREDSFLSKRILIEIVKQKTPSKIFALYNKVRTANLKSDALREKTRNPGKIKSPAEKVGDKCEALIKVIDRIDFRKLSKNERDEIKSKLNDVQLKIQELL